MESNFLKYIVRGKIVSTRNDNDVSFQFFEESFQDESPIKSRKQAFHFFQSLLDVLLNESGRSYEDLFLHKRKIINYDFYEDVGLQIFLKFGDEELTLFHFGKFSIDEIDSNIWDLERELEIYHDNNFSTDDLETNVLFWGYCEFDDEPNLRHILKVPYDFTGKEKDLWWLNDDEKEAYKQRILEDEEFNDSLKFGESNLLEFKPFLHYNKFTERAGISIKEINAKIICSFLNSNGGNLVIGINDNGEVIGLEKDFSLSDKPNFYDYFNLQFDDLLKQFLPTFAYNFIKTEFININDKIIFRVKVFPSNKPVFLLKKKEGTKEFWIRRTASCFLLNDTEEIIDYCFSKWK